MTAAEIAQMQADAAGTLGDVCTITRQSTATPDAFGGESAAPATIYSNLACRVYELVSNSAGLEMLAERPEGATHWHVQLPFGTVVQLNDRIAWNGHTLDVVALPDYTYAALKQVIAKEFRRV